MANNNYNKTFCKLENHYRSGGGEKKHTRRCVFRRYRILGRRSRLSEFREAESAENRFGAFNNFQSFSFVQFYSRELMSNDKATINNESLGRLTLRIVTRMCYTVKFILTDYITTRVLLLHLS